MIEQIEYMKNQISNDDEIHHLIAVPRVSVSDVEDVTNVNS